MENFVNIKTVYGNDSNRTVECMQHIYEDRELLIAAIANVSGDVLNENKLKDKRVLLKPNWVCHSRKNTDKICLRTHDSFLLAALEFILKSKPKEVVIGDAPIQGCNWGKMLTTQFIEAVNLLVIKYSVPVIIKDFRRVTLDCQKNDEGVERNPLEEYLIFDLGKDSYLEPVTSSERNQFRVTMYNPDRFLESHTAGMHKYCITKQLFNSDVIISVPKIKTHQKTGITAALKNIVGLNGDKDFLPHHRIGGTARGGDCYPGGNFLRYWAELCQDYSNRKKRKKIYWFWLRLSSLLWRLSFPKKIHQIAAGWYGNDTTWRMVLDLNKIVNFGKADGTLADNSQRSFFSLSDGIIGGEGDGPLDPEPLNLGIVAFTNNSAWNDICMATLMGMDIALLPLLVSAKNNISDTKVTVTFNGKKISPEGLKQYAVQAVMPPGWLNYEIAKK